MTRNIDFEIAGTKWHWDSFCAAQLKRGDYLTLRLEPDNKHDPHAVAVYKDVHHVGYVPRTFNREVGEAVAKGKVTEVRVWLDWPTGAEARVVIDPERVVVERYVTEGEKMGVEHPPFKEAGGVPVQEKPPQAAIGGISPMHRAEELRNFSDPLCGRSRDPLVNWIRMTGGHCSGGAGPC